MGSKYCSDNCGNDRSALSNPNLPNISGSKLLPNKRVVNLSSLILTPKEINTLGKDLGFTVSPKNIPFESIIYNIENGTQGLSLDDKEVLRQECYLVMMKSKWPKSNLNKEG